MVVMDTENEQLRKQLDDIAAALAKAYELLDAREPLFPEERLVWIEDRKCLNCEKRIKTNEKAVRGCHERCAQKTQRLIKAGKLTEFEAIQSGVLAPKQSGGRRYKTDSVMRYIQERDEGSLTKQERENVEAEAFKQ